MEVAAETVLYFPASQLVQTLSVFPDAVEYVPAGQLVHTLRPVTDAYAPCGQASHSVVLLILGEKVPKAHWSQYFLSDGIIEYVPAGQS